MADSIILSVSELRSRIQDIRRDGMDIVKLSILDSDTVDGDVIPASIHFSGCKSHDPQFWTDYDDLEEVPNREELLNASIESPHNSFDM